MALPPFSKISSIEKKFDSKVKKVWLSNFFKNQKMTNFRDRFFCHFLPFFELHFLSFFEFWKNLIVKLFPIYYQLFFLSLWFLKMTLFFSNFTKKTPFSKISSIDFFFNSKVKKVWLSNFFKILKMTKNRHHFLKLQNLRFFWQNSKTPFSKIPSIEKKFDSKVKKVWLSKFFKIQKMTKNRNHFF